MTTYRHLTAREARAHVPALQSVYAAVFSQPPYNEGPEMVGRFAGWVRDESTRPGFDMVIAEDGGQLIGFAYGWLMPAGDWWRRTDRHPPDGVRGADKFAVMEWAVLPDHRGRGTGRQLMDELLRDRRERWATLTVNPAADARVLYERWGWARVGATRGGKMPPMDVMLLRLGNS